MNDDRFTPETVEEQLDALSTSAAHAHGTPVIRLTQDIERYRLEHNEDVQHALQRAWERIEARRLPIQPSQLAQEQTQPLELPRTPQQLRQQHRANRLHMIRQRVALISLVALLLLLIGGAGLFFQRSTQSNNKTGAPPHATASVTTSCKDSSGQSVQCRPLQPAPRQQATPSANPTTPFVAGDLLASDDFGANTGVLHEANSGAGWSEPWKVQNNNISNPGYTLAHNAPLRYSNLRTADTYAVGGQSYLTAGRVLDLHDTGPFSSYLTNGQVGRSGTTLWLSVLMRKDSLMEQQLWLSLHDSTIGWCAHCNRSQVSIGYFAHSQDGKSYWSLQMGNTIYSSNVPVSAEQTTLLVLRLDFGVSTTGTLYVNPQTLGSTAPTIASVQGTMTPPLLIKSIAYYGGNFTGASSLAEIRLGSSYGVVTPIQ